MKLNKKFIKVFIVALLPLSFAGCQKEYTGEYAEWGEVTNSNATELLKNNNIPYDVRDGYIYIPEDALDKAIYCCS